MIEIGSISELIAGLAVTSPKLVGIDGKNGSGKSTTAYKIAKAAGTSVISLDDFIDKGKGAFIDYLRYEEINAAISNSNGFCIVEGVCLLDAIDRLGVTLDIHVYIKRINKYGLWQDADECGFSGDPSDAIQHLENKDIDIRNAMDKSKDSSSIQWKMPKFRQELILYHARRKPHEVAGYVYLRSNGE